MKRSKKLSIWAIVILIAGIFVATQAFGGHEIGQTKAEPGTGKGPEGGVSPEYGHKEGKYEKGYRHGEMHKPRRGMRACRASELIGKKVVTAEGEMVGTLEDFVVFQGGRVHYGILKTERPDKYVPVPFDSLEQVEGKNRLMVNLEKEKIENAPGFSRKELSTWWKSDIGDEVHSYYGMERRIMPLKKPVPGTGKGPESGIYQE